MPSQPTTAPLSSSRRDFMKLGVIGTLAVTGLGTAGLGGIAGPARADAIPGPGYRFFTPDDVALLKALVPAIMAGALPEEASARTAEIASLISDLDVGLYNIGEANRNEVRKLFDLLTFTPTRILAAGLWSNWDKADTKRADHFLTGWRQSWISQFNNGYAALVKIVVLAEYGRPVNWARSGYAGPPAYALEALPQFRSTASTSQETSA